MDTYFHNRNYGCRIFEFLYKGLKTVFIENEKIKIGILVDRGADIFQFQYKPVDIDFLWKSYQGVKRGDFNPASSSKDGKFLDYYHGGWQELFPNGGDQVVYKGANLPMHGEIHSVPWEYRLLKDDPEEVKIELSIRTYRTCFFVKKVLSIHGNKPVLNINETIVNESNEEMDFMWGHHPSFGPPFLSEDCVINIPECSVLNDEIDLSPKTGRLKVAHRSKWPMTIGRKGENIDLSRIPPRDTNSHDRAYIHGFSEGWYSIINRKMDIGFKLSFDPSVFKYLWFWQVYGGAPGYPWYGTNYNIALEPNSSYPPNLLEAVESGTSMKLQPGEKINTEMVAEVLNNN